MNIALTHIAAAASSLFSSNHALARAMVLGVAAACISAPVLAGQDRDGQRHAPQQQTPQPSREQAPPERMPPPPPRQYDSRQYDSRQYDVRAEEQRRQGQAQEQGGRRGGRLTPDERRELRRQINEAGIDLYPNAPRR
jgi:type IV secretory pathway VirB10-like protein